MTLRKLYLRTVLTALVVCTVCLASGTGNAQGLTNGIDSSDVVEQLPVSFSRITLRLFDDMNGAELYREFASFSPKPTEYENSPVPPKLSARVYRLGADYAPSANPNDLFGINDISTADFVRPHSGTDIRYFYGAKILQSADHFGFGAYGYPGVASLGNMTMRTRANTFWLGPEVGAAVSYKTGRFRFESRLATSMAYHRRQYTQSGFLEEPPVPGHANSPLHVSSHAFQYSSAQDSLALLGEIRLAANYRLTTNSRLSLIWSNTYLSDIYQAHNQVDWALHNSGRVMGVREESGTDAWIDSLQLALVVTR